MYISICNSINYESKARQKLLHSIVLTQLHSKRPKLYAILVFLSAVGLKSDLKSKASTKKA